MVVVHAVIEEKARAALRVLARRTRVRAAYLFGSRIEGTADQWGDIDIAAFIEEGGQWNLQQRVEACVEARREVGDEIELHLFPAESLENPPRASFAQYILRHGTPLDIDGIDAETK
ncbi:MAG: nucleotidyltransferase domain-containing protein [Planctomycetes bacterium]|nr:nucleotidyltransferase domain-containing protein [Planctomycetota bacterium]